MSAIQYTFEDLGPALSEVTFCVVDLETTGTSPTQGAKITEIGAVKVRGGEVISELQTLVNPDEAIAAYITVLTGITDAMVVQAPRIAEVLPSFLEFAHDSVLVAHNAPFDIGFLRHAARQLDLAWPSFTVLDTAVLARRVLHGDEVRNVKLATLARYFNSPTAPDHRALSDARATVHVLHGLLERFGSLGVHSLPDLQGFTSKASAQQRRKRHLADAVPNAPGVYLFRDRLDHVLYVGTSRELRKRVRSYFTAAETRSRMGEMVNLAERVEPIVCATALEAQVRELRLIDSHQPPFNRRAKYPDRMSWLKLTNEPWPRISIVRQVLADAAVYLGPFSRRRSAEDALLCLHEVFAIRQCHQRLTRTPDGTACALAQLGRCLSPCDGSVDAERYSVEVGEVGHAMTSDPDRIVAAITAKMAELAEQERFEQAGRWRDRMAELLRTTHRMQRLKQLTEQDELVAAAPSDQGWQVHVVRYGRLCATAIMPHGTVVAPWTDALIATAESVSTGPGPTPAASVAETECILRWLETPHIRIVRGSWHSPLPAAAKHLSLLPSR